MSQTPGQAEVDAQAPGAEVVELPGVQRQESEHRGDVVEGAVRRRFALEEQRHPEPAVAHGQTFDLDPAAQQRRATQADRHAVAVKLRADRSGGGHERDLLSHDALPPMQTELPVLEIEAALRQRRLDAALEKAGKPDPIQVKQRQERSQQ
jgi:hypothetical protein